MSNLNRFLKFLPSRLGRERVPVRPLVFFVGLLAKAAHLTNVKMALSKRLLAFVLQSIQARS